MSKRVLLTAIFILATMLAASNICASTQVNYVYDANGSLISGDGLYYEYNDANQLVKVHKDSPTGTVVSEYVYDYNGQRIKKIENGVTTYYIGKYYEQQVGGDHPGKTDYYFANGERVAKRDATGNMTYYHSDNLGSTEAMTDAAGNIVLSMKFYPFGELREDGDEKYGYNGKERDDQTDLSYYEARFYSPELKHFTQADDIMPELEDPQDLNRYSYVRNNPMTFTDPDGHKKSKKEQEKERARKNAFKKSITIQLGKSIIKQVGKDILKYGAKGLVWGISKGHKTMPELISAAKGSIQGAMAGKKVLSSCAYGIADFLIGKTLDAIEGKGEDVPILGDLPGGKLLRYHNTTPDNFDTHIDDKGNVFVGGQYRGNVNTDSSPELYEKWKADNR